MSSSRWSNKSIKNLSRRLEGLKNVPRLTEPSNLWKLEPLFGHWWQASSIPVDDVGAEVVQTAQQKCSQSLCQRRAVCRVSAWCLTACVGMPGHGEEDTVSRTQQDRCARYTTSTTQRRSRPTQLANSALQSRRYIRLHDYSSSSSSIRRGRNCSKLAIIATMHDLNAAAARRVINTARFTACNATEMSRKSCLKICVLRKTKKAQHFIELPPAYVFYINVCWIGKNIDCFELSITKVKLL